LKLIEFKASDYRALIGNVIIRDGITEPKSYDKSKKITGATNTKKVKCGKQFATHCLFVTKGQLTCITAYALVINSVKKDMFFLSKPMHVQKYVVLKDLAPRVFPLLVSASSFLRIEDLNSCPPDLELDALIKWLASRC
jgi:hypothetical protein